MSSIHVLDASAVLCLLFNEQGANEVEKCLTGSKLSAVNFHEVIAKLSDRGVPVDALLGDLAPLDVEVMVVDRHQAEIGGMMRAATRRAGLSLGDRSCLALAKSLNAIAVTADRAWADLELGIEINIVRHGGKSG